jgi:hypothetical protein
MKEYKELEIILRAAYNQAAFGKGKARHARPGTAWIKQPILWIQETNIGIGFALGQVVKSGAMLGGIPSLGAGAAFIASGMRRAAAKELLGAIVYLAAAAAHISSEDGHLDSIKEWLDEN